MEAQRQIRIPIVIMLIAPFQFRYAGHFDVAVIRLGGFSMVVGRRPRCFGEEAHIFFHNASTGAAGGHLRNVDSQFAC